MSARYFIDTNIFIYSFDNDQSYKKERASTLIEEALYTGAGVISTQVIQEFLNVATQKFAIPMLIEDAKTYLRLVMNPLCQVYPDLALFESSLEIHSETRYSLYDSLILAASIRGECEILYSEDLQDGQEVRGVRIVDPFLI